jgi:hypothetical protein
MGEISVKVFRVSVGEKVQAGENHIRQEAVVGNKVAKVHEKSLKGQAKSHSTL